MVFLNYTGFLRIIVLLNGWFKRGRFIILMYHRVFDWDRNEDFPYYLTGVSIKEFERQMRYLTGRYTVIPLKEAVSCLNNKTEFPPNAVVITFDDGYRDCYTNVYPVLSRYGLPATVFLTSGNVSSSRLFWVDETAYLMKQAIRRRLTPEIPELRDCLRKNPSSSMEALEKTVQRLKEVSEERKRGIIEELAAELKISPRELKADYNLSWEEVREMSENGISFGAHTVNHPILTRLPVKIAEDEIVKSRIRIEKEIDKPCPIFCYPNGSREDFDEDIKGILKKSGFIGAVTTIWGVNNLNSDCYELKRMGVDRGLSFLNFKTMLSGVLEMIKERGFRI